MKRTIQAVVVAALLAGAQAALAFGPSSNDDLITTQFASTYADRYADKGAPALAFPSGGEDDLITMQFASTYADRHAGETARAPMVFPSSGDDVVIWTGKTRADQLTRGASDPALSQ